MKDETARLGRDVARAIRRLYERGLVSGVGGNASVLLPSGNQILITPAGYFKGGVAEGDLVRVSLRGKVIGIGRPSSELATHLEVYRLRKDVKAVVHAHPPTAVALMTAGVPVPVMTPGRAGMISSLDAVDFATPAIEGASAVEDLVKRCVVVGIRNHGFFSLGSDLHEAASKLEVLEESAKIFLAGQTVGGVLGLTEEEILRVRSSYRQR